MMLYLKSFSRQSKPFYLLVSLVLTISCTDAFSQIFNGDLTLNTQSAVESFNYAEVTGDLHLESADILNLDGLSELQEVGGSFRIIETSAAEISLPNLGEVGELLLIQDNESLLDLSFPSLITIGGTLRINDNPILIDISFPNLQSIYMNFFVDRQDEIESIEFPSLSLIGDQLFLIDNDELESLSLPILDSLGTERLTSFGGSEIRITQNLSLTEIYMPLVSCGQAETNISRIDISNNNSLSDCCLFENIQLNPNDGFQDFGVFFLVFNNAFGCNTQAQVESSCLNESFLPGNDNPLSAETIFCNEIGSGSITCATSTGTPELVCGIDYGDKGVWYRIFGNNQEITANTDGSDFDTRIHVFTGEVINSPVCVESNDETAGLSSEVVFNALEGQDYWVYISGPDTSEGNYTLNISCNDIPTIPQNDEPCFATGISCNGQSAGSLAGATDSGAPQIMCGPALGDKGVWYIYEGNNQEVTVNTFGSDFNTKLHVFTEACILLECIGGNDDSQGVQSEFVFNALDGESYWIYISGSVEDGNYVLNISCNDLPAPPLNDLCDSAEEISIGAIEQGDNTNALGNSEIQIECGVDGEISSDADVWFRFTAPNSAVILETLAGTNTDTQMQVFDECGGEILACNDDGGEGFMSRIEFNCGDLIPGNEYIVQIDGWSSDDRGTFELSINAGETCDPTGCDDFKCYLADVLEDGTTNIYEIELDGNQANLSLIASSEYEVHIALNEQDGLIYAVSKLDGSYRTLNPETGAFSSVEAFETNLDEIVGATFNPDGKLLLLSQSQNTIYSIDLESNEVSIYDSYSPTLGGDIAFGSTGELFLATREGFGSLYRAFPDQSGFDILIGDAPQFVTGLANTQSNQFLLSHRDAETLEVRNYDGSLDSPYELRLDGETFTAFDGDLASGCLTGSIENLPLILVDADGYKLSTFPNPTEGPSVAIFVTGKTERTALEIYDMNGRLVEGLFSGVAEEGLEYRIDFDGFNIPNGVYFYRLTTKSTIITKKFMIAR